MALDDHERVVEVVGDAAGEPADRVHLLRLAQLLIAQPQLLFGAPPLGHVTDDRGQARLAA